MTKISDFIDNHVDLSHYDGTREDAEALFSYIASLFGQGKDEQVLQFIKRGISTN